jgi:hypothetical protein
MGRLLHAYNDCLTVLAAGGLSRASIMRVVEKPEGSGRYVWKVHEVLTGPVTEEQAIMYATLEARVRKLPLVFGIVHGTEV